MSKIIKGSADEGAATPSPARPRSVIPSAVYEADRSAEQILEVARRHADEIVAASREEAERLRAEYAEEGRLRGHEQAVAIVARAEVLRARLLERAESDVARLAVAIARKVLDAELQLGTDAVQRIVSSALESARLGRSVLVRVSPGDLDGLEAARPLLLAAAGRSEGLRLVGDPSVGPGGCMVDSELGTIDARLDEQLAAIERALAEAE